MQGLLEEECPDDVFEDWEKFTDQCACQFRCQFVTHNLLRVQENVSPHLRNVKFNYFESHEGKNFSDTIGALAKQALYRPMKWSSILSDGVGDVSPDADQEMVIAEQVKQMIISGMNYENGTVALATSYSSGKQT